MEWFIGYLGGALLFAFVVIVLSALVEDAAGRESTVQALPFLCAIWPLTATVFIASMIGALLRGRAR